MFQPLKGLRVVDLSQVLAGPYASYTLALLGAEVIKIEKPGVGDWTRQGPTFPNLAGKKMGFAFMTLNAQKKSVTLDLKTPEGVDAAKRLVGTADVFLENHTPGVAERLGLGFDDVRALKPDIVYCSVSAFGQDGTFRNRSAYDHVIQGMCGIMLTTGAKGAGPTKVGAPYVDYATGMNAALAVLAGILEVRRTGQAVHVDVAMLDTALTLMASLMTMHLSAGWVPEQSGNEAWSTSPSSGAFETSDGCLMLAANNDRQFQRMCRAIGCPEISADSRWAKEEHRRQNAKALRALLEARFLTRSAAEWEIVLNDASVPASRVRRLDETLKEPHMSDRQVTCALPIQEDGPPIHVPSLSFKADGHALHPQTPPAELGADTAAVLSEIGYSQDDLRVLRDRKVI